MRVRQMGIGLILALPCMCLQAATQEQRMMTVIGKLTRVAAIGGESTGWAVQLEHEITVDSKQVDSIEVDYPKTRKLEKLENKRVKATGRLSHRHGVETDDRPVVDLASIKEAKAK